MEGRLQRGPGLNECRKIGLGVLALHGHHRKTLALPLGEAFQPLDEDNALGRRHVGAIAVEDGDRFEKGAVLEEDAAIAGSERMHERRQPP